MLASPLVSVHIITYNQVDFITDTLMSALEQDYDNLEVVVSDDGSTDGTVDMILKFAEKYPDRLVPIVGGANLGITGNSNRALARCSGKYIAFQGGDDVLYPGKIRKQVEWMESRESRVISGHDVEVFDSKTRKILGIKRQMMPNRSGFGAESIIKFGVASFYSGTSIMVRKSAIPSYGFDERIPTVSDWKFTVDCLSSGGEYGCIDGIYAGYRKHGRSITDLHMDVIFKECIVTIGLLEAQYPNYLSVCKIARAKVFYKTGNFYLKMGDKVNGKMYLLASANTSPLIHAIWRYPLFLAMSILPISIVDGARNFYRFVRHRIGKQNTYY